MPFKLTCTQRTKVMLSHHLAGRRIKEMDEYFVIRTHPLLSLPIKGQCQISRIKAGFIPQQPYLIPKP